MKIKKTIKKKNITIIFIIMTITLLYCCGYSMGKAYQSANVQVKGKIAEPIFVVENNPVIEMNENSNKKYYNFKIKNSKENGEITQVDLEYNIQILAKTEKAISFKLYKEGENEEIIPLINNKTQNIQMKKGELQEDTYRLEIIYDQANNNLEEDIIEDVQIKVHSEQVTI